MKNIRIFLFSALLLSLCSAFTEVKKDKEKQPLQVYAFGVAASFNDTIVYCTDIQVLDSAQLNKDGFLVGREQYSLQLKSFVENQKGKSNYTCMIYFSPKKEKLEKKAVKVKDNYKKGKGILLETIASDSFVFKKLEY